MCDNHSCGYSQLHDPVLQATEQSRYLLQQREIRIVCGIGIEMLRFRTKYNWRISIMRTRISFYKPNALNIPVRGLYPLATSWRDKKRDTKLLTIDVIPNKN